LVWVEPVREWLEVAQQAGKLASSQDLSEIKYFIRKIGSNRSLLDREVHWEVPLPFRMISEYRSRRGIGGEVGFAFFGREYSLSLTDACQG
jgi:hypothetical protein